VLEYTNCNLCKNDKTKLLISLGSSNLVKCKICGLVYQNPRPSEKEMLRRFTSEPVVLEQKEMVRDYAKIELFKKNLKRIERYSPKGRLLDIGCGYGTFLKMAKNRGWQTWGVEISDSEYKHDTQDLGLNIFKGTLKEARFPDNFFDIITLWDVLNELNDPLDSLLEVSRILRRGGLLLFRVRNLTFHLNFCYTFRNLAKKLNIGPVHFHLYVFSPKTVKRILRKVAFRDIKITNSELTIGDPYCIGGIFGRSGIIFIKEMIFYLCKFIFYLTGGLLVLGPSILVLARKPLNDSKKSYAKN